MANEAAYDGTDLADTLEFRGQLLLVEGIAQALTGVVSAIIRYNDFSGVHDLVDEATDDRKGA